MKTFADRVTEKHRKERGILPIIRAQCYKCGALFAVDTTKRRGQGECTCGGEIIGYTKCEVNNG